MRLIAALGLLLTGCGLIDLEHALDNSPPEHQVIDARDCAQDSAQAADTVRFERCGVTFPDGGKP